MAQARRNRLNCGWLPEAVKIGVTWRLTAENARATNRAHEKKHSGKVPSDRRQRRRRAARPCRSLAAFRAGRGHAYRYDGERAGRRL